jgi:ubiquitin-protein ligase
VVKKSKFEKDFSDVTQFFPKLGYKKTDKGWVVSGKLDICDQAGDYWNTFDIVINVPMTYPYCSPSVIEASKIIQRENDWHIGDDGSCCLDIPHRLWILQKVGTNILDFIRNKVYPYFANQVYRENAEHYAAGEYKHYFEGVQQFYAEDLGIQGADLAIQILQRIIANQLPGRNDPCICGKNKFKNCHMKSVDLLKLVPIDKLKEDLESFSELKTED